MVEVYLLPTLVPSPLPLSLHLYFFSNVLHVHAMSKNLISVPALCVDNPINVIFFYSFCDTPNSASGVRLGCLSFLSFFLFLFTINLLIHKLLNISLEIYFVAADYKIYSNSINGSVQHIKTLHFLQKQIHIQNRP